MKRFLYIQATVRKEVRDHVLVHALNWVYCHRHVKLNRLKNDMTSITIQLIRALVIAVENYSLTERMKMYDHRQKLHHQEPHKNESHQKVSVASEHSTVCHRIQWNQWMKIALA